MLRPELSARRLRFQRIPARCVLPWVVVHQLLDRLAHGALFAVDFGPIPPSPPAPLLSRIQDLQFTLQVPSDAFTT